MLNIDQGALTENKLAGVRSLYDRHAAKLLGYIFDVVKDRKLAEEYLVKIFCEVSNQFDDLGWEGSWCQLQRFAKHHLMIFVDTAKYTGLEDREGLTLQHSREAYFSQLTKEQKHIFSEVYYYGKTIAAISIDLDKTEDSIRKTLKEAFAIMRKSGEN